MFLYIDSCKALTTNSTLNMSPLMLKIKQINSMRIYYYHAPDVFIAGTSIQQINTLLRSN